MYRNDAIDLAGGPVPPGGRAAGVPRAGPPRCRRGEQALIAAFAGAVPVLGVCLGHQCIGEVFGGRVVRAPVMHGKTSSIAHDGRGVFAGLPDPLVATRYHSLVVEAASVPPQLEVSAWSEDGTVMGVRHRTLAVEGVQFHPESVLTEGGHRLLANWLARCGQPEALASGGAGPPLTPRPRRAAPARELCPGWWSAAPARRGGGAPEGWWWSGAGVVGGAVYCPMTTLTVEPLLTLAFARGSGCDPAVLAPVGDRLGLKLPTRPPSGGPRSPGPGCRW